MSNFHRDLDELNLHSAKGFTGGEKGSRVFKNEIDEQSFEKGCPLPPALEFIDASVAPPVSPSNGDVYVLITATTVDSGWNDNGITNSANDWVRFNTGSWKPISPVEGDLCYDKNTGALKHFDGTDWEDVSVGGVTDGDYGDITVSSSGAVWTIKNGVVTLAKIQNIATASLLGRITPATGVSEVLTATQARSILNVADGANAYVHPNHSGDVTSVNDGAQTAQPAIITGKPSATIADGDLILIADVSNSNALKQVTALSVAQLFGGIYTSSGTQSTLRTGAGTITGDYNSILGGFNQTISGGSRGTISGGQNHVISAGNYNTIGGGLNITMSGSANASVAGGGQGHTITNQYCFVGGGYIITMGGLYGVGCGGYQNTISGSRGVNVGGQDNIVDGTFSGNLGGQNNDINGKTKAFIVGSGITADRDNCTFVENLSIKAIPTSSAGLPSGSVWNDSGTLKIV